MRRLAYHFEAEKGWINDPNGLCWFKGQYHAFFQHNPFSAQWGRMHWGHAVSDDLVHWKELPIALYPDQPYEDGYGCFSGSALVKDDVLTIMYTAVSKDHGQTQCIVTSRDGLTFEKYAGNPVIPQSPVDPASKDFRDPKIFPYGDEYRMVCGAGIGGEASILLYRSEDLLHWEYMGPIFQSRDFGPVPECPDLFPLGDKWVLVFSRMDEGHRTQFVVGDFDGEHFTPESFQFVEKGKDFYAPQTFLDPKGRRIMIAWLHGWDRVAPPDAVRCGALTIPRELSLVDGRVRNYPVEEAWPLMCNGIPYLRREDDEFALEHEDKMLASWPIDQLRDLRHLQDGNILEIFANGGESSFSFLTD